MYLEHQPIIEAYAKKNPDQMYNTLEFVIATANRRFSYVPRVLVTKRGFSPAQRTSLAFLYEGRHMVYRDILNRQEDELDLMRYLVTLPHLGMVKAGFAAQLITGSVGCLDTWNVKKLGLDKNLVRLDTNRASYASVTKKLTAYTAVCRALGGTRKLWDRWCEYLANEHKPGSKLYPWPTAYDVSLFHVTTCCR